MALPINVSELIENRVVGSNRIEYKKDWNPEPIVHTIAAFANDIDNCDGGYIVIGVEEEDDLPVIPVSGLEKKSLDKIQKDILNKCSLIEPRYIPVVKPDVYKGKDILVIWAPGGDDRPYRCPVVLNSEKTSKKSEKAYYIRKMSNTINANQREERELISLSRDVPFDDRINLNADILDMRSSLISEFLHSVGSELYADSLTRPLESVATDMRLIGGPKEYRKPVNVGLMFFNERPDKFFPYTQIEVVIKPDPTGLGMRERIFRGPVDKQLMNALEYIRSSVIEEYITKLPDEAEAVRIYNWPYRAVEEALCNAIYHRSYLINEPVTVTVTPDRMEILSLPGPDISISDKDLSEGILVSSRYRNRRIGDFLKELKMIEGHNTGIPLIIKAMKQNGSGKPEFKTDDARSYFRVILPIHSVFINDGKADEELPIPPERIKSKRRSKNELRHMIILVLREKDLSMRDLALELGYAKLTDTVKSVVNELVEEGVVEFMYPSKTRNPNQKIRLVLDKKKQFRGACCENL